MEILMGTKNPGKIEGAKQAFEKYFENVQIQGISVDSEVGDQPINKQIFQGAKNRVKNLKKYAKEKNIKPDYYIASEAGITNLLGEWIDINAAVIESKEGLQSVGTSQGFQIPEKYIEEIKRTELRKSDGWIILPKWLKQRLWRNFYFNEKGSIKNGFNQKCIFDGFDCAY